MIQQSATDKTYHYDENTDKHSYEVGEKGQRMLHIVHVTEVCFLYNLLCVHHHVSNEDQESKVQLHQERSTTNGE